MPGKGKNGSEEKMAEETMSREEAVKAAYEEAKKKEEAGKAAENTTEQAETAENPEADTSEENVSEEPASEEAAADEAATDNETSEDGEMKKGFFKKKDKKDELIAEKDGQIAELKDNLLRNRAEFENFRKRSEKEKSQMFEIGAKSIVEKVLPVIDNFERGFDTLSDEEKETPFALGMKKIYEQMLTSLAEAGVKPIEAMGQEFNPDFHNAIMHEDNDEVGENIIVQEFQKGYTYRDTVVRYSMVKVAN